MAQNNTYDSYVPNTAQAPYEILRQLQIQIIYCTDCCTLYNPAFLHMTVLCCLQSPPPYIHERRPRGKKEREGLLQGHSFKILFSDYYLTQQHFKSDYCTVYHIPLYFLTIGWILHVIQYIYTRYEILFCSSQYYKSVTKVIQ